MHNPQFLSKENREILRSASIPPSLHASSGKNRFKKTTPVNYTWDSRYIHMCTAKVKASEKCWLYKHYQAVRKN